MNDSTHSTATALAGVALAASLLLGCGDPLVDAGYRGEPLAIVQGDVLFLQPEDEPDPEELPSGELRVAVFWSAGDVLLDETIETVDSIQEQVVTTSSFPASYKLFIYQPPPESLLDDVPGSEHPAVIGMVLLYLDLDGNKRWSGDDTFEPIIGGAQDEVLIYAPEGMDGDVVEDPLAPGFHAVLPQRDELCIGEDEEDLLVPLDLADPTRLDLVIGPDVDTLLYDLDCDAVIDEWCSVCPAPDQLDEVCNNFPTYCAEELSHCESCEP